MKEKNKSSHFIIMVAILLLSLAGVALLRADVLAEPAAGTEETDLTFSEDEFRVMEDSAESELFKEEFISGSEAAPDLSSDEKILLKSAALKFPAKVYTGLPITQTGSTVVKAVVDGVSTVLTSGKDYKITYSNNTAIGTAVMTITGKGSFTGTIKKTFKIVPPSAAILSASSQTRRIILNWKTPPACADGIQIQYGTDKSFSVCSSSMIKNRTTLSKTIINLTAGKTYYLRLRSYKKAADGRNYYSAWSKTLSVKLEKNAITVLKKSDKKRTLILDNAPESAKKIRFAVWSGRMGQDDLVWYDAEKLSNGRWKAVFSVTKHRNDGKFYVCAFSGSKLLSESTFKTDASETATEYTELARSLTLSSDESQLILVGAEGTSCTLTMLNKNTDGTWHQLLTTSGNVGLNGIGDVTEWNRKTPVGVYGFCEAFGIYDDPGTKLPYTKVDSTYYWVDDVDSRYYNQFVTTKKTPVSWNSAEHIIDYTDCYQYCLALDFNKECVSGAGSAIFLHAGSGNPTLGCISVPLGQMKKIMQYVIPGCKIVIDKIGRAHV